MKFALDNTFDEWNMWCETQGLPRYTASQIYQWIFEKRELNPLNFTNLPHNTRQLLDQNFVWQLPTIDSHLISKDGSEKFLLEAADGELFEMVMMPYDARVTLCISSQVGCKMGCTFCQTGKLGLRRNLTSGEILSQIFLAPKRITNVVFMGMGEPLDNYDEVLKACTIMVDPQALSLSKARVTISTSGLVPEIEALGKQLPVRLAISLHNAHDETRSRMMPINRRYPLSQLKDALLSYPAPKRYGVTIEYVMIQGENDRPEDAKRLVHFLHGINAKVNLIPINHFPGMEMHPSTKERLEAFQSYLTARNIPAPVRYSRGQDISGGCGQLAAKRKNELNTDPRKLARLRRVESFNT